MTDANPPSAPYSTHYDSPPSWPSMIHTTPPWPAPPYPTPPWLTRPHPDPYHHDQPLHPSKTHLPTLTKPPPPDQSYHGWSLYLSPESPPPWSNTPTMTYHMRNPSYNLGEWVKVSALMFLCIIVTQTRLESYTLSWWMQHVGSIWDWDIVLLLYVVVSIVNV